MGFFSKLFGGARKRSGGDLEPNAKAAFEQILEFMSDETVHNNMYQRSEFRQLMEMGGAVDEVAGATGDFGRDIGNPIPVNGPIGEIIYISNMSLPSGVKIMGHRLGFINRIDVYETVALDGSLWDILYFDMLHTRKSRKLPSGYRDFPTHAHLLFAANAYVEDFPSGLYEAMLECVPRLFGTPLVSPQLQDLIRNTHFSRPESHLRNIGALRLDEQIKTGDGDAKHLPDDKTHFRQDISPPQKESPRGIALPHYQPGDTILSNYLVEDIITTGGMGVIYVTTHKGWKVKVAIKSPTEEMLSDREFSARITKEADAWINLGLHPNIAYCYFVRAIEEVPHIFVEYVDGGNLKDWIESGRCADLEIALDLAIQFCHGMAYAHSKGMIHRDIKPANILMTKDGVLKITDFGIARWGKEDTPSRNAAFTDTTKTIGFIGTPYYASPEQLRDAHTVHEETDIFSFGVCLWEMLLGRRPYPIAIEKIPLPDPLSLDPDLPPELATLLSTLVAYDEEERKALGGFASLSERFKNLYSDLFRKPAPHCILETLDLRADGLNNRGVSYFELGNEEEAVNCWEQALKEDPQHLEATFNYGYYRWQEGALYDEVLRVPMSTLKSIHENRAEYWRLLAWLYYELGEIDALEELQNSVHSVSDTEFNKLCGELKSSPGRVRTLRGDGDLVTAFANFPDGRYVLTEGDTGNSMEIRHFVGHNKDVSSIAAFSSDGRYVVYGCDDGTIRLWEIATGKELWCFEGHSNHVSSVAFSPDGRHIISGSWDYSLRFWETATGKELRHFGEEYDVHNIIHNIAFSSDGRYVLTDSKFGVLRLWEVATGRELKRFKGHNKGVTSVAFSPDGRYLVSGGMDNTIRLWEVASGEEVRRFEGHSDHVSSVAFSSDGSYILAGGQNWTQMLFPWVSTKVPAIRPYPVLSRIRPPGELILESREIQRLLASATDCIQEGALKEAYTYLRQIQAVRGYERNKKILELIALCGLKGQGIRRDLRAGWHVTTFEGHRGAVNSVTISPDDRYILTGSRDRTVRLWEAANGKELRRFEIHRDIAYVCSVAFSPDGRYILSGNSDKTIRLWESATGKELWRFERHSMDVSSIVFSPDGEYILSMNSDNTFSLWEAATGKERRRFEGHNDAVKSVAFSHDGKYVLSGSSDKTIRLWEAATGKELRCLTMNSTDVSSNVFSPDGEYILSGNSDNTFSLWDAATCKERRRFEGHSDSISFIVFFPDGRYILSGSMEETIRLWEAATGKEIKRFEGHNDTVNSVAFSPDGRYIISGSDDMTVRLWETATGKELERFEGHSNFVNSVAFSPDGRYIISGSYDKTIRLWELDWEWEFPEESS